MATVRRLTEDGIAQFRAWLASGGPNPIPSHLLHDSKTSEFLEGIASVEPRTFSSRLELGEYLARKLGFISPALIRFDACLWDWLSLFYIDALAPAGADGKREIKQTYRYTLELKNRLWSRHIVRMSWMAVVDHGKFARVMLAVPITKQSEVLEQLAGQQEVFGAQAVVETADRLYWDDGANALKRGAQGKGAGTPRRLVRYMRQFRRTYDPPAMNADQLLDSLPPEFDRWRKGSSISSSLREGEARPSADLG